MRFFNTAGPCDPEQHYMVPPESRLPDLTWLLKTRSYFVVHAPRQSGKTTTMRALADRWNREQIYAALHISCETARIFSDDVNSAEQAVWGQLEAGAEQALPEALRPPPPRPAPVGTFLSRNLAAWAEACPRPLVLILDEIDALTGNALISVLSQLRSGYPDRPDHFPSSVILCGMRDVRDYKMASGGASVAPGSTSPFNIKLESLRLGNFTEAEVRDLFDQHTADTGQPFTPDAIARTWELTAGQPWLTNALAYQIIVRVGVIPPTPITAAHIDEAAEQLIIARATHLDSLLARLKEPRVRAVLEPILAGEPAWADPTDDDYSYVRDLGLISAGNPPRFANPIYQEVIVRVLSSAADRQISTPWQSFVLPDGRLDLRQVLEGFVAFWRQHGELLATHMGYPEAAPMLIMMAWLGRFGNGAGGVIEREIGVGSGRVDLLLRWPVTAPDGSRTWQREAFELKVWRDRDRRRDPVAIGLVQIDSYLQRLGLDHGTLVVFDARAAAPEIDDRGTFEERSTGSGRRVVLLRA